jgi:hypothetical protein
MFSELDNIIFPDSCEVIKLTSQHYVFPIFKCGRSSLTESMTTKGWKFVDQHDIQDITQPITVFLRDPKERFFSGVNTFLQQLDREISGLDTNTILYFINKYLFLNRHYTPQFFWILNLSRFAGVNTDITFRNMSEISQLTEIHSRAEINPMTQDLQKKIESFDWSKLELYFYLDQILLNHIDRTISIQDLIKHIQTDHTELYNLIFQKTLNIVNVLPKT